MKTLIVNKKFNNKKILTFLGHEFPNSSLGIFYKALRKKDIRVNNMRINENIIIYEGDEIKIYLQDHELFPISQDIKILYEDKNILAVFKPKSIEITGKNSLTEFLMEKYSHDKISPCHRLDRNTTRHCTIC